MEEKIEKGIPVASQRSAIGTIEATAGVLTAERPTPVKKPPLPKAVPEDIKKAVAEWKNIVAETDTLAVVQGFLRKAHLSIGGEGESAKLLLVFDDHNGAGMCSEEENLSALRDAIENRIGKEVELEIRENETGRPSDEIYPDLRTLLSQNIKMEIEIED